MFSIADVVQMAVVNRRAVFLLFLLFLGSISATFVKRVKVSAIFSSSRETAERTQLHL